MTTETDYKQRRYHIQRQIMITQCIKNGVWEDRDHFKNWLYAEFGTTTTKAEKWSNGALKVLYIYLKYFLGEMPRPRFDARYPWRINQRQIWRIREIQKSLGWSEEQVNGFVKRQLGVPTFIEALSKSAATKVITGLNKIYAERKYARNN
jgi:hypothetical protein